MIFDTINLSRFAHLFSSIQSLVRFLTPWTLFRVLFCNLWSHWCRCCPLLLPTSRENLSSAVVDFFKHKNVFITGATGFVGVAIIEKLLYAIPDIGKIYILLRAKNGKTLERRLEDIHRNSVFNRLRQLGMEERLQKIVSIEGDIGEPGFGISDESLKTLQDNVNIVIHSAATLDFFTSLHMAEKINLQGTIGAANLASQMKNLKAFVHVSSAYANSFLKEVKEELYMENERSQRVNVLLSTLSEEALKELEPKYVEISLWYVSRLYGYNLNSM